MTILKGVVYIICAAILSLLLSVSVNTGKVGAAASINLIWPPFLGIVCIILFLITCWVSKKLPIRKMVVSLLCMYLVYVGMALHFGMDHWPLVIW